MLLPFSHFWWSCLLNEPSKSFFWEIWRICTIFIAYQYIKSWSSYCPRIYFRDICLFRLSWIGCSKLITFNLFLFLWVFAKGSITSWSISFFTCSKYCMHISSSPWLCSSLIRLRKWMFLITFLEEVSFWITEYFSRIYTSESVIRMTINYWKNIFSSFCMFEGSRN